jgi:hypothetical protein
VVAAARGLPEAKLRALVEERIEQRFAGFIGEPLWRSTSCANSKARLVPRAHFV